ncbi:MAG TPA: VCBS repeat-containing protein [Myxococcota bacterium]|nr:VCBS repeat-containing protein [Myxococcota bacterium]
MPLLLACASSPVLPTIGPALELDPAGDGVAAADLDGDGFDELFYIHDGVMRWAGGRLELEGSFQRAAAGDLDGDGREELVLATGMSREYRGPAHLEVVSADSVERLASFPGDRTQIPELRVIDGQVWVATYANSRVVESGWVVSGALDVKASGLLATRSVPVGEEVVLAHVYGPEPKSDGDVRVGARVLPSHRGARSLAVADLDDDGDLELLAGDGWHYAYGERADGRVTLFEGPRWEESRAIAHFSDDYSAREIEVLEEGWILVTGTSGVHLLVRDSLGWKDHVLRDIPESAVAVAVRTPKGPAVLVSGTPSVLVPLR